MNISPNNSNPEDRNLPRGKFPQINNPEVVLIRNKDETINELNQRVRDKDGEIDELQQAIQEKDDEIQEKDDEIDELQQAIQEKDDEIQDKDDEIDELQQAIQEKDGEIEENANAQARKNAEADRRRDKMIRKCAPLLGQDGSSDRCNTILQLIFNYINDHNLLTNEMLLSTTIVDRSIEFFAWVYCTDAKFKSDARHWTNPERFVKNAAGATNFFSVTRINQRDKSDNHRFPTIPGLFLDEAGPQFEDNLINFLNWFLNINLYL